MLEAVAVAAAEDVHRDAELVAAERRIGGALYGAIAGPALRPPSAMLDINDGNDITGCMASLTIRDLDPEMKDRLRIRAARHGRSMEEEVRVILRSTLAERVSVPGRLGTTIHRRFEALKGVDLELPSREPIREPPRPR